MRQINLVFKETAKVKGEKVESYRLVERGVSVKTLNELYYVHLDGEYFYSLGGMKILTPGGMVLEDYPQMIEGDYVDKVEAGRLVAAAFSTIAFSQNGGPSYLLVFNPQTKKTDRYYCISTDREENFSGSIRDIIYDKDRSRLRSYDDTREDILTPCTPFEEPMAIFSDFINVESLDNTIPLNSGYGPGEFGSNYTFHPTSMGYQIIFHDFIKGKTELVTSPFTVAGMIKLHTDKGIFDITQGLQCGVTELTDIAARLAGNHEINDRTIKILGVEADIIRVN